MFCIGQDVHSGRPHKSEQQSRRPHTSLKGQQHDGVEAIRLLATEEKI